MRSKNTTYIGGQGGSNSDNISSSEKGQPNGVATLDGSGQIPSSQLPSYVDDVLEYPSVDDFPVSGEASKIYIALDENRIYRWTGSTYVEITASVASTVDISLGGTGATTAEAARENLGINIESAANGTMRYKSPDGTKWLYITDSAGWGAYDVVAQKYLPAEIIHMGEYGMSSSVDFNTLLTAGTYTFNSTGLSNLSNEPPVRSADVSLIGVLEVMTASGNRIVQRWHNSNASATSMYYRFRWNVDGVTEWTSWIKVYHSSNTTTDSNGFIKAASPIVQLFADKIEMNDEAQQQNIEFEKLGVGDYLIKGSYGFSQDGWYIETPKDANGNVLVAVVYEQLENSDISVKTYDYMLNNKGRIVADTETPLDIPETRWIDLRLQEIEVTDDTEQ